MGETLQSHFKIMPIRFFFVLESRQKKLTLLADMSEAKPFFAKKM